MTALCRDRRRRLCGAHGGPLRGRGVGGEPGHVLPQQPGQAAWPCSDAARDAGVKGIVFSQHRGGLRRAGGAADHRGAPQPPLPILTARRSWPSSGLWTGIATPTACGYVALRYFNAAGAHPDGDIGEDHDPEVPPGPALLRSAASAGRCRCRSSATTIRPLTAPASGTTSTSPTWRRPTSWPWRRWTGVRCRRASFNLGNGEGFSVRDVIRTVEQVAEREGRRTDGAPPGRGSGGAGGLVRPDPGSAGLGAGIP